MVSLIPELCGDLLADNKISNKEPISLAITIQSQAFI
jgi:hypothetical protein